MYLDGPQQPHLDILQVEVGVLQKRRQVAVDLEGAAPVVLMSAMQL